MIKTFKRALGLVTLIGACVGVSAADYRMLTTSDNNFPGNDIIAKAFANGVDAATKGGIKISMTGPETVPPFEALRPVSGGAFHFLFTNAVFHSGTTSMGMTLDAMGGGDNEARRKSGIYELLDKHYEKHNLKIIALPISRTNGYNVILRSPPAPEGDLKGRKIRTTPTYAGVMALLGGTSVVLPPAEVYSSLDKGVVEGATWPALGLLGTRWYEVAKYVARPTFGVASQMILMNRDAWNKLSPAERDAVLTEGRKVEDSWYAEYVRRVETEEKDLKAKGVTFVEFGPQVKAQLEQAWADGIWKIVEDKNGDDARALHTLAKSKGLTK